MPWRLVLAIATASMIPSAGMPQPLSQEQVQSDISTREISIQSNFSGIKIVLFGAIDFTRVPFPAAGSYDVIMVVRGPEQPVVVREKERMAGIWINGESETFPSVPGFYSVLSSRPLRAIATEETLKTLGVGFSALDFGIKDADAAADAKFRSALIELKGRKKLFQESDNAVKFVGRSLFRGSVELPANVPIGRYATHVFLFREGQLISQDESPIYVYKAGFERIVYLLAFRYPFIYGLLAVTLAALAGLAAWAWFRRRE
jgi:uncharacterized protein (TIGR02186 family)